MIPRALRRNLAGARLLVVLCALWLGGCTLLPEAQMRQVYVLPVAASAHARAEGDAAALAAARWTLSVETPLAAAGLNSERIVVMPEPHRMSVYEGASWSGRVPELLRARIVEGFRRDGRVLAVSDMPGAVPTEYALELDLQAFQSEYAGQPLPTVVIGLDARLVDRDRLRVVASRRFGVREATAGVQVPAVVAAFGTATDRLAQELVEWTVAEGNRAQSTPPR